MAFIQDQRDLVILDIAVQEIFFEPTALANPSNSFGPRIVKRQRSLGDAIDAIVATLRAEECCRDEIAVFERFGRADTRNNAFQLIALASPASGNRRSDHDERDVFGVSEFCQSLSPSGVFIFANMRPNHAVSEHRRAITGAIQADDEAHALDGDLFLAFETCDVFNERPSHRNVAKGR